MTQRHSGAVTCPVSRSERNQHTSFGNPLRPQASYPGMPYQHPSSSGSPSARIRVERRDGEIEIEVQDDGRGMPIEKHTSGSGVGLSGMQERSEERRVG